MKYIHLFGKEIGYYGWQRFDHYNFGEKNKCELLKQEFCLRIPPRVRKGKSKNEICFIRFIYGIRMVHSGEHNQKYWNK